MNAIVRFFGFGARNHVVERSVVPIDNSMDVSNENLHHRYQEFISNDIDKDIVYYNSSYMTDNI
jgi:chemotaxis regulatin CheY-phosphate phosphatase CheZ